MQLGHTVPTPTGILTGWRPGASPPSTPFPRLMQALLCCQLRHMRSCRGCQPGRLFSRAPGCALAQLHDGPVAAAVHRVSHRAASTPAARCYAAFAGCREHSGLSDASIPRRRAHAAPVPASYRPAAAPASSPQSSSTAADGGAQQQAAVLLVGFHPEEVDVISQNLPGCVHELGAYMPRPGDAGPPGRAGSSAEKVDLHSVGRGLLQHTVEALLGAKRRGAAVQEPQDEAAPEVGRIVLLVGPVAQQLGATLNDDLVAWGVAPALIAGYQER